MMYLHKNDKELFRDIILMSSEKMNVAEDIVEKDYYVTLILKELAKRSDTVVFKGGTSLSKAFHIIDRFSEDIDITFTEHLGESKRKALKYKILRPIGDELGLPIGNWDRIESDKNYNHYDFEYAAIDEYKLENIKPYVKLETALMSYSFPTERRQITNYVYEALHETDAELLREYGLEPFWMRVQSMNRTFIDKLFAVCDYYMIGLAKRNSRHLYDLYKLYPYVTLDGKFTELVGEVREHRAKMDASVTPSARPEADVLEIANELCENDFYAQDYRDTTEKLISDKVDYETVKDFYKNVMKQVF